MKNPAVSIILPCYNAASTLHRALQSIQTQDFTDTETILIDDGSEDNSVDIAEDFAQRDPRIQVLRCAHAGIVASLQTGIENARGRYIARMDADDISLPGRLQKQVRLLEASPQVALCGTLIKTVGDGLGTGRARYDEWVNSLTTHAQIRRELFVECPIPHPTFMMRREAYDRVGGYRESAWPEDYDLVMRIVIADYELAKVDQLLLHWHHSPDRLSQTDPRYGPDRFRDLKRHYLRLSHLKDRTEFYQWGAGEVGKTWLREWNSHRPLKVVDINPRKIGREIHQTDVIAPDDLPGPGKSFTLVAVGAPGARTEIRQWFARRGYTELDDYVFLA